MAAMKVTVLSLDRLQSLQPILKLLGTRQRKRASSQPLRHRSRTPGCGPWSNRCRPASRREAKEAWSSLLGEMTRATAS